MMGAPDRPRFRRIVIPVDTTAECRIRLAAAAGLAARMRADLAGVFVERQSLFDLAALPFAREVTRAGARPRAMERVTLERELRAEAALARRLLEEVARARHLVASFHVLRGRDEADVAAVAEAGDLVALVGPIPDLPPVRAVLLYGRVGRSIGAGPIVAVADAGEAGREAMDVAGLIAASDQRPVVCLLATGAARREAVELALRQVAQPATAVVFRALGRTDDPAPLLRELHAAHGGLLVVHEAATALAASALVRLADAAPCPVLVLRKSA